MSRNLILHSNSRVWAALASIRVFQRSPETMGELRDALNARRAKRAVLPTEWRDAAQAEYSAQLRAWGKIEIPERIRAFARGEAQP